MTGAAVPNSAASGSHSGFGLTEFLIAALILLVIAGSVFGLLKEIQHSAGYQTEVQTVLNNTRLALQTIGRYIRQAGNDPTGIGLAGITIMAPDEVRIQSDITGSAGPGNPDKGDPDGDILDSGENVTIRYNSTTKSLEIVTGGGAVQVVAGSISGLSFRYYDSAGAPVTSGEDVRKVNVTVGGVTSVPDPVTHSKFGIQLNSDFETAT